MGEEPTDIRAIRVMLARKFAAYADNMLFSTDFRLQSLDELNAIVGHMKADADEENAGAMSVTTPATG
jgi:hypothetical protein